jgi:uncharacterized membrane protein HdeD (DUF308 family)
MAAGMGGADLINALRRKHRRTWWALVVRGLLAIAVGVLILARPRDSLAALALTVAVWALVCGMTEILHALETRTLFRSWWILLISGLISMCFGVAAVYFYPALSLAFMAVWVGFLLAGNGVIVIYASLQMKNAGISWLGTCLWGVLSVLGSAIAFLNPSVTLAVIPELLAVFSIVSGFALLVAAWRIRAFTKHLAALVHPAVPPASGGA